MSWTGAGDGISWSDLVNWSGGYVPGAADDVSIVTNNTINHASGSEALHSLQASGGGTLNFSGDLTLATASSIGLHLSFNGTLRQVAENLQLSQLDGTGTIQGSVVVDAGAQVSFVAFSAYNLAANVSGAGTLVNAGSLTWTGGSTYTVATPFTSFNDLASTAVQSGTLVFTGGGTLNGGTFAANSSSAKLQFGDGRFDLGDGDLALTGSGTVILGEDFDGSGEDGSETTQPVSNAEFNDINPTTRSRLIDAAKTKIKTLGGISGLGVTWRLIGQIEWQAGFMKSNDAEAPSKLLIDTSPVQNGVLTIMAGGDKTLKNFIIENRWAIDWVGGQVDADNSTIDNRGTITITANNDWVDVSGEGQQSRLLNGTGTITKGGNGRARIFFDFENRNNLLVNRGTLAFRRGNSVQLAGRTEIASGATLDVITYDMRGGELYGPGTLDGNLFQRAGTLQPARVGGGYMVITGTYTQLPDATLEIDFYSPTAYDTLYAGRMEASGKLKVVARGALGAGPYTIVAYGTTDGSVFSDFDIQLPTGREVVWVLLGSRWEVR